MQQSTQVLKFQMVQMDASTEGFVGCMWTHLRVQMDASTDGLVAACGHPGTTIQMDTEAELVAEETEWCVLFTMYASTDGLVVADGHCYILWFVHYGCLNRQTYRCTWTLLEFYVCLLWMPQQTELLLHMDTCYVYVPDLLWRQSSKPLMNCIIHV